MNTILALQQNPPLFAAVAAGLGLIAGSFLNVVIHRLPKMLARQWEAQCRELSGAPAETPPTPAFNLMTPRSRCPHCGHAISALENIPIVSFLWLRGRCSACRQPIGWRYPMVEALAAVAAAVAAWQTGFGLPAMALIVFGWALIGLAAIDLDHQLLPDSITLPLLWSGLLLNINGLFVPLASAVAGAVIGYLALWLLFHAYRLLTGKEGMGHGDFKLLAAIGAWLGWQALPLVILLASLVGAVVGLALILLARRDHRVPIPFGPFLCGAGWIAALWGAPLTQFYLQLARPG